MIAKVPCPRSPVGPAIAEGTQTEAPDTRENNMPSTTDEFLNIQESAGCYWYLADQKRI